MREQRKHENLTYLALWSVLFAVPVLSLYLQTANDASLSFNWSEVFMIWKQFAVYLIVFLLHNYLLAPLLVYRHKRVLYFCTTAVILGLFLFYQCSTKPMEPFGPPHDRPEMIEGNRPPMGEDFDQAPPPLHGDGHHQPHHDRMDKKPPVFIGEHDIIALVVVILMLGMNLGVKLYFKSRYDQQQLTELEKQNLERQLEYLRYQINPHFFMNTLNNIHALVDIDSEEAKHSILELSKMMRFVLYEGNKKMVPLSRELDFLRNYITLMGLRYTDKVKITVELPSTHEAQEPQSLLVPPLLFVTFVENAFKHGVSYQHDSFIEVSANIEGDTLSFHCRNSKVQVTDDQTTKDKTGGVGLRNVRQRLNLIYGDRYKLTITDSTDTYNVDLTIPL